MLNPPYVGYWCCIWCTTFYVYGVLNCSMLHPRILVVYMVYLIILCYIPRGIDGVYGVLYRSILHPQGYWWCIWYITSFYVTSSRILVVYMVYFIVICYYPQGTGGVYGILHRSMLHTLGYLWYIICTTTLYGVHPPGYWRWLWCTTSFYVTSPRILVVYNYGVLHCSM